MLRLTVLLLVAVGLVRAAFWMEDIAHLGRSPFHPDPNYQVFRNVKDFGAVGDGVTDDTSAINIAINSGGRCEPGACKGSTVSPATVYFPAGTYLISDSINDAYYTQLIGDPTNRPVIKASSSFSTYSFGLIDANPYQDNGLLAWNSTNTFFRQIRNLVLDTTSLSPTFPAIGIHWPSSQATSISNCLFQLSDAPGNNHTGLFIEEGSGGLLNDLYFYGGNPAAVLGNQQFTSRNMWFFNADTAIRLPWDWSWTFKSVYFKDCRVGIMMDPIQRSVGSITLIDSWFTDVETAIYTTRSEGDVFWSNGTLAVENVQFNGVDVVVRGPTGTILTPSSARQGRNDLFITGHVADKLGIFAETGYYNATAGRSANLLDGNKYYERSKPQYDQVPAQSFLSARKYGAQGDGNVDDTEALNKLFVYVAQNGYIAYLDAGIYIVTDTVFVPPNARIVGEALASVIMGTGPNFQDMDSPHPVVQVGRPGDAGYIEWSDTLVSTRGPCPGAVLIDYNLYTPPTLAPSGMWDVHTRIGGFPGTNMQLAQCPAIENVDSVNPNCIAAYMSMYIAPQAGGLVKENCWLWVADHDLEDPLYRRISVYAGRGLLVQSQRGRIWISASSSEHHVLYQYQLVNTRDIYMGHIQSESPYYQPFPPASYPFPAIASLNDPDFNLACQNSTSPDSCQTAWAVRILNSENVAVYGAGLYSFFINYNDTCSRPTSGEYCQARVLSVDGNARGVKFLGLSTVGAAVMVQEDGVDLVEANGNNSTFADTLALYVP